MSYSFDPKTEEELATSLLIEDGIYNFEVVKSTRKTSKSGNAMCELQLNVWDKDGKINPIFDYLVFSQIPLNIKKVKHFCDAVGLQEEYKKGQMPEELERLCGKLQLGSQDERPNPNGGVWPRKNTVLDYMADETKSSKKPVTDEFLDDIPF